MGNSIGNLFKITSFGESHGIGVGVVIDGCPAGFELSLDDIQKDLERRRPGQSKITSPRNENDHLEILSGLENNVTLGSPICIYVKNKDQNPSEYKETTQIYRPSHADYTYKEKYGTTASSGGGRASARETVARVAAGSVAKQFLKKYLSGYSCTATVKSIHNIKAIIPGTFDQDAVDKNLVRCVDSAAAEKMEALICNAGGNSYGGQIFCRIKGVPTGLGEPVFDKLEANLAKAMLSIPASKAFEIGSGFSGTYLSGLEHNDPYEIKEGKVTTSKNHSGGIQGGISNGMDIEFSVGFKPTSTIKHDQKSVTHDKKNTLLPATLGRHDPCVLPRAVVIVEAMTNLVLMDHYLLKSSHHNTSC